MGGSLVEDGSGKREVTKAGQSLKNRRNALVLALVPLAPKQAVRAFPTRVKKVQGSCICKPWNITCKYSYIQHLKVRIAAY